MYKLTCNESLIQHIRLFYYSQGCKHRIAVQSISEQGKVHLLLSYKMSATTIQGSVELEHETVTVHVLIPSDGIVHSLVDSGQHPAITLADVVDICLLYVED